MTHRSPAERPACLRRSVRLACKEAGQEQGLCDIYLYLSRSIEGRQCADQNPGRAERWWLTKQEELAVRLTPHAWPCHDAQL